MCVCELVGLCETLSVLGSLGSRETGLVVSFRHSPESGVWPAQANCCFFSSRGSQTSIQVCSFCLTPHSYTLLALARMILSPALISQSMCIKTFKAYLCPTHCNCLGLAPLFSRGRECSWMHTNVCIDKNKNEIIQCLMNIVKIHIIFRNIMKEKRGDAFVTKKNLFMLV